MIFICAILLLASDPSTTHAHSTQGLKAVVHLQEDQTCNLVKAKKTKPCKVEHDVEWITDFDAINKHLPDLAIYPKPQTDEAVMRYHVASAILNTLHASEAKLTFVELGVASGKTMQYILAANSNVAKYVAIDFWDWDLKHQRESSPEYVKSEYERVQSIASMHPGRAHIVRNFTDAAAAAFEEQSVDVLFHDASHYYEGCKSDLDAWWPKVREGGIICGHDFSWHGVAQAVRETCKTRKYHDKVIYLGADDSWYFAK